MKVFIPERRLRAVVGQPFAVLFRRGRRTDDRGAGPGGLRDGLRDGGGRLKGAGAPIRNPRHASVERIDLYWKCVDELLKNRHIAGTGRCHRQVRQICRYSGILSTRRPDLSIRSTGRCCVRAAGGAPVTDFNANEPYNALPLLPPPGDRIELQI